MTILRLTLNTQNIRFIDAALNASMGQCSKISGILRGARSILGFIYYVLAVVLVTHQSVMEEVHFQVIRILMILADFTSDNGVLVVDDTFLADCVFASNEIWPDLWIHCYLGKRWVAWGKKTL